jgi:hypothetical protein
VSKISELSDGGSLVSSDYLIAVRSGGNVKVRMDQINVDQVDLGDNEFIRLGNSQDLTMVHTSTQSIINQAGTGDLLIQKAGATKLTINASGIDVTGTVTADGLTVDDTSGTVGLFNSTAVASTLAINNTHANAWGSNIAFRTGGTDAGYFGSIGSLLGNTDQDLSVYSTAGNGFRIYTNGNNERLRVTSAGNVGIGLTTGISSKLHVNTEMSIGADADNRAIVGYTPSRFYIGTRQGGTNYFDTVSVSGGNLLVGTTSAFGTTGTTINAAGLVYSSADGDRSGQFDRTTNDGEIVRFSKAGTTVGSIGTLNADPWMARANGCGVRFITAAWLPTNNTGNDSDNTVDLGMSSNRFKDLYLSGGMRLSRAVTSETEIESYNNTDSGGAKYKISFKQNGTQVGVIEVGTSSTAYLTSSDYRLKENVAPLTSATERLKQLNPLRFNFIADADKTVDGFLAHEVQDVVPEAIGGTKDAMRDEEYEVTPAVLDDDGNVVTEAVMGTRSVPDYQGIDQSKLVPLLVATIQELEARIAALES